MKVQIFYVSLNPSYYDMSEIREMSFDDAVEFFENDEVQCCTACLHEVDLTKPNETMSCSDEGDELIFWTKVSD